MQDADQVVAADGAIACQQRCQSNVVALIENSVQTGATEIAINQQDSVETLR